MANPSKRGAILAIAEEVAEAPGDRHSRAVLDGDAETATAFFANDAIVLSRGERVAKGRKVNAATMADWVAHAIRHLALCGQIQRESGRPNLGTQFRQHMAPLDYGSGKRPMAGHRRAKPIDSKYPEV